MQRRFPLRPLALVLALVAALAAVAGVAGAVSKQAQTFKRYTLTRSDVVKGQPDLAGYARAYALLPGRWTTKYYNGATQMRFTVPGSCKAVVDVAVTLQIDADGESPAARVERLRPAEPRYVHGSGTRNDSAAWRVIRPAGTKTVRALYTQPLQADWPTAPEGRRVWLEVTADARARNTSCHTGGMREAVAHQLVTAFGAMSATGYPDNS